MSYTPHTVNPDLDLELVRVEQHHAQVREPVGDDHAGDQGAVGVHGPGPPGPTAGDLVPTVDGRRRAGG